MNPETNKFEELRELLAPDNKPLLNQLESCLLRANGSEVPKHWTTFKLGELVVIKDYTFKVAYIGETAILFEPVGPQIINKENI
jgi:hypothetical protein